MKRVAGWLPVFSLILIVAGYFGPWVPHKTAALTVTGLELAEFAKFFPQVQGGTVFLVRAFFYLPLVVAAVLLAALAGRSEVRLGRLALPLMVAVLLFLALLPFSIVDALRQAHSTGSALILDPQYVGQLALGVAGVALVLLAPLADRLPRGFQTLLFAVLALAGAVPPLWQFVVLRPLVVALYGKPFGLGWGLIVCTAGFVLLSLSGLVTIASSDGPV